MQYESVEGEREIEFRNSVQLLISGDFARVTWVFGKLA